VSVVATATCLILAYPTAYLIVAASTRVRMVLIVLVFIPYLTSLLARTYAWVVILGDRGLINALLIESGLITSPLPLIYNRMAVYIGMVHIMLPLMILPLISVMQRIDRSLTAAACSMGARPFAAFWRVFVPLTLPGVRSGGVLVFVLCLGFYITPQALGGLRDAMLSTFIADQVASALNVGAIAASAFILLSIAIAVVSMFGLDIAGKHAFAGQRNSRSRPPLVIGTATRYLSESFIGYRSRLWKAKLYRARGESRWRNATGVLFVALIMFYLLFPSLVVIIMSFGAGSVLEFPPSSLSLRWYRSFFDDLSWSGTAWNSVQIGVVVAILSTIAGTLAACGLSRSSPQVRSSLTMAILAPITFPVIIVGVATYLGLAKVGLIGTKTGLILAHSIGSIAFVTVIVSAALVNIDRRLEQAAMSMRAGPLRTFTRVTLPLIRPAILGGAVFAFIHSFDEVVLSSLVGGSIRTLPLRMWESMRNEMDPTIAAVTSLLMVLPVLWLTALYVTWWKSRPKAQSELPDLRA
ncbi:ABC transporter permease subunit, partial [Bradyrhizobium sp. 177]|uniref:ABC transporter permease subunit n=1 Tax=Bradyrhizobium sp. 177 TaxID=2782647 RepID=UPI001FF8784D